MAVIDIDEYRELALVCSFCTIAGTFCYTSTIFTLQTSLCLIQELFIVLHFLVRSSALNKYENDRNAKWNQKKINGLVTRNSTHLGNKVTQWSQDRIVYILGWMRHGCLLAASQSFPSSAT